MNKVEPTMLEEVFEVDDTEEVALGDAALDTTFDEGVAYPMALVVGVAAAALAVTGYSDGKRFFTSCGSFLYQSGSTVPVRSAISEPVGMAVLSTSSTDRRTGSMVLGLMSRPSKASIPWWSGS